MYTNSVHICSTTCRTSSSAQIPILCMYIRMYNTTPFHNICTHSPARYGYKHSSPPASPHPCKLHIRTQLVQHACVCDLEHQLHCRDVPRHTCTYPHIHTLPFVSCTTTMQVSTQHNVEQRLSLVRLVGEVHRMRVCVHTSKVTRRGALGGDDSCMYVCRERGGDGVEFERVKGVEGMR